jgi:uncharacterized protein YdbL (DUF1318 family)
MKARIILTGVCILCAIGCARVRVEAPKEAFKVDISMRLDVYQHVAKDIDSIENIVSGAAPKAKAPGNNSSLNFFVGEAYAQDGLGAEVEQAALRRRDRKANLVNYESKGIIGENEAGLTEIRSASSFDAQTQAIVRDENSDRMIIYKAVAQKNGTSLDEVQKLYAKRLKSDAPSGTPVESGGVWAFK